MSKLYVVSGRLKLCQIHGKTLLRASQNIKFSGGVAPLRTTKLAIQSQNHEDGPASPD
jgi:hypothetical protein